MPEDASFSDAYLLLANLDANDLKLFQKRLALALDIVDGRAHQGINLKEKYAYYRVPGLGTTPDGKPTRREIRVSVVDKDIPERETVRLWSHFDDGTPNFSISERTWAETRAPETTDPEEVIDYIESWEDCTRLAFSDAHEIGSQHKKTVKRRIQRVEALLNALVHAHRVFDDDERFVISIVPQKPYAQTRFLSLLNKRPYEFLIPQTAQYLDGLMPDLVMLEKIETESMTEYRLTPPPPTRLNVSNKTLLSDEALAQLIEPVKDFPVPQVLDELVPAIS